MAQDRHSKITFLQTGDIPYIGIMSLSAVLKQHGFSTDVFSTDLEEDIVEAVLRSEPTILACSAMTTTFRHVMAVIRAIKRKKPNLFIIVGGPHPTFFPEIILTEDEIDAVCRGEGEYALLELATSMEQGAIREDIQNIWIKRNGRVVRNEVRALISDLDYLPFPDRDIFFTRYPFMADRTTRFMMSRGCPFNCSYCFNKGMKELYKGKGSWLRYKSIDYSIAEIKDVHQKYPLKWVSFMDDTFNADKIRFKEFISRYEHEVGIPFICQMRVDLADEEQIEYLKQAGVSRISIGIEHGDEEFRKKMLYRNISNKQILDFGRWINKRKIRLATQNILGFPEETVDLAFATIELNASIKPEIADCSILNPYPGTDIYDFAKQNNYLDNDFDFNNLHGHSNAYLDSQLKVTSVIRNKHIKQLINLRCFFMILVWYPWLKPLVKVLILLPYNRLYEFIFQITGTFRLSWRFGDTSERKLLLKKLLGILVQPPRT
mgnify:CR=1 FL=1